MTSGEKFVTKLDNFTAHLESELYKIAIEEFNDTVWLNIESFVFEKLEATMDTVTINVAVGTARGTRKEYDLMVPKAHLFDVKYIQGVFYTYILLEEEKS